jgi:nitrite reductase/ring-hydroxylating ferredoxin subunit
VSAVVCTWALWAYRYEDGELWHVTSERGWVELLQRDCGAQIFVPAAVVPVLAEEVIGDPYAAEVTHYGWRYARGNQCRHDDAPTMIQIRVKTDPSKPRSALMLLDLCFPGKIDDAIERGDGKLVTLRITERPETDP